MKYTKIYEQCNNEWPSRGKQHLANMSYAHNAHLFSLLSKVQTRFRSKSGKLPRFFCHSTLHPSTHGNFFELPLRRAGWGNSQMKLNETFVCSLLLLLASCANNPHLLPQASLNFLSQIHPHHCYDMSKKYFKMGIKGNYIHESQPRIFGLCCVTLAVNFCLLI